MNCLIWVLLLLSCGNNGSCFDGGCGCGGRRSRNDNRNDNRERNRSNDSCGCMGSGSGRSNERQDDNDCGCRTEFRSEPRFEQRPFVFNQNAGCGCDESQN